MDVRWSAADTPRMAEVNSADSVQARIDEKRQAEKSEEEKKHSKAAFEKRLQQDKTAKSQQAAKQHATAQTQKGAHDKGHLNAQQQKAAQLAKGQKDTAKAGQQAAKQAGEKQQGQVLAHVRGQAGQQQARLDPRARLLGGQKDAEKAASESQEGARSLLKKGDESVNTGKVNERRSARETESKDRVRETEKEEVRNEAAQEAKNTQQAQQAQGAQQAQAAQQAAVDADGRRQQGQGGSPGQQQQQQQQNRVAEQQDVKGPSQGSIRRAAKAEEIQKLCEKLLDNFYMGAAPDGSAMMRMELKEGVLAGLVIDLKVDDKRRVKLTLSGGNKEAIDFVTSSRGELSRALGKKGLVLESVDAT